MNAQLIQLTESLRWALETIDRLMPGDKASPQWLAAQGHLYQAECEWQQFDRDMAEAERQEAAAQKR